MLKPAKNVPICFQSKTFAENEKNYCVLRKNVIKYLVENGRSSVGTDACMNVYGERRKLHGCDFEHYTRAASYRFAEI